MAPNFQQTALVKYSSHKQQPRVIAGWNSFPRSGSFVFFFAKSKATNSTGTKRLTVWPADYTYLLLFFISHIVSLISTGEVRVKAQSSGCQSFQGTSSLSGKIFFCSSRYRLKKGISRSKQKGQRMSENSAPGSRDIIKEVVICAGCFGNMVKKSWTI